MEQMHESTAAGLVQNPAGGLGSDPASQSKLAALSDHHLLRSFSRLGADCLELLHDVHALGDGPEDHVLAVEPRGLHGAEEELRAVGVGPRVGHGQDAGARVLEREVLVGELAAVDRLGAVAVREVPSLAHEVGNDTMERATLEVERLAHLASALLAGAEAAEVLSGLGRDIGSELHYNAACSRTVQSHVEEHFGI